MDLKKITDIEIEDIDFNDAPDFVDAHITSALYDGKSLTDKDLDELNEDSDFVYESVLNEIYTL